MRYFAVVIGLSALIGLASACFADVAIQSAHFSTSQDLGTTTINWDITVKPGDGGNFNIQMFLQNVDHPAQYIFVSPGIGYVVELFPDNDNKGSFTVNLPVGHYGGGKAILFLSGSNYMQSLPDIPVSGLNVVVATSQLRIVKPEIDVDTSKVTSGADGKEHIPFVVKEPANTTEVSGGGYWAMVKGTGGFAQNWVDAKKFMPSGDPNDDYKVYTGEFDVAIPTAPGLYNLNVGFYNSNWNQLDWLYPGVDFENGNWVVKADPSHYTTIADAFARKGGLFAIGGNFGNAIAFTETTNTGANYFRLLHSRGISFIRTNYDPDQYLDNSIYREKVDQIVQNQLEARLAPILAPQDMPAATPDKTQLQRLVAVDSLVASTYKGLPVVVDILNEPHGYKTWADWKKDAVVVLKAVKAADPHAATIVGFEGYSEDGRSAAKDPIDPSLVTYYALHSYHAKPQELSARIGNLTNVLLEEWQNDDPAFAAAIQTTPFVGEAAWAWTTPGQDSIPLVKSVDGAKLTFTPAGAAIDEWQQGWEKGEFMQPTAVPVATKE